MDDYWYDPDPDESDCICLPDLCDGDDCPYCSVADCELSCPADVGDDDDESDEGTN